MISTPQPPGQATNMVKVGIKHPDTPVLHPFEMDLCHCADTGKYGEIGTASRNLRMFGKPDGFVEFYIGVLVADDNIGVFALLIFAASPAKYAVAFQHPLQVFPHGRQGLLYTDDAGPGAADGLYGQLLAIFPAVELIASAIGAQG